MGISPASAVSTALNLFTILSMPMGQKELDRDMSKINAHMHELVPKLFIGYDRNVRPTPRDGKPLEIQTLMVVDHIEKLNEEEQAMTFHGTLIMMWRDERLMWEAEDFGRLGSLAFNGLDITRLWSPEVIIKGITIPSRQLIMLHNTIYTLKSSGLIVAELSVSVKAACRIDLTHYPNDNQTCFVFLFTPAYSASSVTFTKFSALLPKQLLQGSIGFSEGNANANEDRSNILNTTTPVGFKLIGTNVQRFYAYGEYFTVNESVAALFSNIANTVLRFEICLQRQIGGVYAATVSIPIFCISMMAFVAVTLPSTRLSLLLLIVCLLLSLLQNDRMSQMIPADFDSEPFCIRLSRLLLLQLVSMLIFRVWFALETVRLSLPPEKQKNVAGGNLNGGNCAIFTKFLVCLRPSTLAGLGQIQLIIRCLLAIEAISIFWLLFC